MIKSNINNYPIEKEKWKSKVYLDSPLNKTKKPSHFCKGLLLLAPPLGESYKFDVMITYSRLFRSVN